MMIRRCELAMLSPLCDGLKGLQWPLKLKKKDVSGWRRPGFIDLGLGPYSQGAIVARRDSRPVVQENHGPYIQRVWLPDDDSPGLAMSRTFGDFLLKNDGIISTLEISHCRNFK